MAAGWVAAVRNVWIEDVDIDFAALEREWQLRTFETNGGDPTEDDTAPVRGRLLCCVTGFEDPTVRQEISDLVQANGGIYTGDLTKRVTHLIAYKPEGRKYQAAKNWGIQTVSIEWVRDSVERGMILDEKCYDPVLSKEERGMGAWNKQAGVRAVSLGKRLRENTAAQEDGKKKLRRTTSMKLNSQRDNLWGDILGKPPASEPAAVPSFDNAVTHSAAAPVPLDTQGSKISSFGLPEDSAIFASCCFFVHGFSETKTRILVNTVASLGGLVAHSLDEVVSASGAQLAHRFLIVPQDSKPENHPKLPENIHIVTEFYIERCMHKKYFFDPSQHAIGRPFPAFPIPGFEKLSICTAGFTGVDLNQLNKSVQQLGASYEERFTPDISVLVCHSLSAVRKQKLDLALTWKVPVVSADWLWECISTGYNAPIKDFLFPELGQKIEAPKQAVTSTKEKEVVAKDKPKSRTKEVVDKDLLLKPLTSTISKRRPPELDGSAFAPEKSKPANSFSRRADEAASNFTTTFETAVTHQFPTANEASIAHHSSSSSSSAKTPLSETTPNVLNKPAPADQASHKSLTRTTSEVADSEDDEEMNDAPPPPPPETPEEMARRLEIEKAARIAAERQAISNKLASSLLHLTGASTAPAPTVMAPSAFIPSAVPETEVSLQDVINATGGGGGGGGAAPRKRDAITRVLSNISTGSNTSTGKADSTGKPESTTSAVLVTTTRKVVTEENLESFPASTQLEYEDPEVRRFKKQLMNKMKGGSGSADDGTTIIREEAEERLTLAEMRAYRTDRGAGSAAAAAGKRRTRRR